ncbi:MAG: Ig-like domain-containing protein [Clostridia bacterium]|nr:Ig-like domain-containing protein [Clostridia bacterium]
MDDVNGHYVFDKWLGNYENVQKDETLKAQYKTVQHIITDVQYVWEVQAVTCTIYLKCDCGYVYHLMNHDSQITAKNVKKVTCTEWSVSNNSTTFNTPFGTYSTDKDFEVTPPLGHKYGEWISNDDGTHTRFCANDPSHTETADCTLTDVPAQAQSCTTDGYDAHKKCEVCGYRTSHSTKHATGHTDPYVYNAEKSGSLSDNTCAWAYYECGNKCGDYYMLLTVTARDGNGDILPNAKVVISGNGVNVSGTTDENGIYEPGVKFKAGEYDVKITFTDDEGDHYTAEGKIAIGGDKVHGDFGYVRGAEKFRCKMCPTYEKWKKVPVIGWFVIIIHFFVHYASYISHIS